MLVAGVHSSWSETRPRRDLTSTASYPVIEPSTFCLELASSDWSMTNESLTV